MISAFNLSSAYFTLSSLLMMFWAKFSKNEVFLCAALLILIFVYLSFIVAPFFLLYKNRSKIRNSFFLPLNSAINLNIKSEALIDQKYIQKLASLEKVELELGLMEIKHEKNFLEKRMLLIIGPIDKLGILPGIISAFATVTTLDSTNGWLIGATYGYMVLVISALFFYELIMRYNRMIELTELVISKKR
ncbi:MULTISPECIES: hypothetical protein [Providencia]|uniref:hypothetical protein n=1 Tax=Providencia TaxID=586 RepID=UPI0013A7876E|nr:MULTISPECIES: hypothetical protein [Providencia]QIB28261.1 hypothetical protein G3A48_18890 [Providencia stuartii]QPN42687.1 hypothetical protein I3B46_19285 [Providencia sp. 2.29]